MGDYGHGLEFGVFLNPDGQAVRLARLADEAGLDLVTFQDHPYQPAFLDTWTVMSYVAAATKRVRLAGNVLNLPLRNPAVLARSVASLDLLSGGRVELGIGAGAFWDAIEAMGGRRLDPPQAVTALGEAIEIIRQVWDTGTRGGVRVDGEFYRVAGAKRGPAPAHPVAIWVGAYKPRMLRLTARVADGWLPSMPYLGPGQLTAGNAAIDAAAAEAGRDPAAIRRLLNINGEFTATATSALSGPPRHWAEYLAELALTEGISTFILAADEPDVISRYAAEVVPAVRELVAEGRRRADDDGARGGAPGGAQSPEETGGDGEVDGARASLEDSRGRTRLGGKRVPVGEPRRVNSASQELVRVHDMLRAELASVKEMIGQVAAGRLAAGQARSELNQMTMRQNNWTLGAYCESYCRVVTAHHGLEDTVVFTHLRKRDESLAPVLDRLQQEHRVIHGMLDSVDAALVAYINEPGDLTGLRQATDLLSDTLLAHLGYEERELSAPLDRFGLIGLFAAE